MKTQAYNNVLVVSSGYSTSWQEPRPRLFKQTFIHTY